ncbi:cell division septal protein FtsQ [Haloferula luteola]|uniref:Cell division septal protein FtsQ n=1 Tax=Haloferula luteola TaxID=595692 RepID=A0A840V9S9_9BACT|nr:FtsQ-type POTRA domain-containing protein [Haloferula luteola]MBB5352334.1 cell division septal protein FtsQ [Haloferula luteola]
MFRRRTSKIRKRHQVKVLRANVMSPKIFWFDFKQALFSGFRWLSFAGLLVAAGWGIWQGIQRGLFENPEFRLRRLTMNENTALSDERLLTVTGIDLDGSLFDCRPREIREKILSLPEVLSARVTRQFPGSLDIQVTARQPAVWVACSELDIAPRDPVTGLLVDSQGMMFPCTAAMWESASQLPVIQLEEEGFSLEGGMKVKNESFLRGMRLLTEARKASDDASRWVDTIRQYKGWGSQLVTRDGTVATFSHGDLERQMGDFLAACQHASQKGRKIATIELVGRRNLLVTFQDGSDSEGVAHPIPAPPEENAANPPVSDLQRILER